MINKYKILKHKNPEMVGQAFQGVEITLLDETRVFAYETNVVYKLDCVEKIV